MRRIICVLLLSVLAIAGGFATLLYVGLPMHALPPPAGLLPGALSDLATDPSRPDLFSGAKHRAVPFQMLYPASAPGAAAPYVSEAARLVDALAQGRGWTSRVLFGRIGTLAAPWTNSARPAANGPFPVIIYLPGVTGYMQMGSFQTAELAAHGYIVVTLNQPGAVAVAVMPDRQIILGMTRPDAQSLIAPAYRQTDGTLPGQFAALLAPDTSIVPYFAADVGLVLDRLAEINADPQHVLHGLLDLDHVGVMGMSLGAIVTAQACAMDARIDACLMMDAPVPTAVASIGLRQAALWISRPKADQRLERERSGGWPEDEIDAQANSIAEALSHSEHGRLEQLNGLFHLDFTDIPSIQPILGWLGQSGPVGIVQAHRQINQLTAAFFAATIGPSSR